MRFDRDDSAVTREVLEHAGDAAAIETTGRAVFATFDINPAMFVGVVCCEVPFDALVDAAAPRRVSGARRACCAMIHATAMRARAHIEVTDLAPRRTGERQP